MSDISITSAFSFSISGQSGGVRTATTLALDFGVTPLYEDSLKVMATTYDDIDLPSVGWTNLTWAGFINLSETDGEDITLGRHSQVIAGLTKDADTAGASVPATLTAGHYTEISSAGTSQGKTWEVGDLAIYLGSSGTYAQLRPAPVAKLKPGETAQFRIPGDAVAWKAKAATGTPYLGYLIVGTLDE